MTLRSLLAETVRPIRRELRTIARRTGTSPFPPGDRLHLGCGSNLMPGWINVDLDTLGAVDWDLSLPIPIGDGQIGFIYSEHFIEHITLDQGLAHFRECHRLLTKGGIMRISTPNLRHLAEQYLAGSISAWREQDWSPHTPAQFLNEAMRLWGHQFIYDEPEIRAALREAGFASVAAMGWRESKHPELTGLETRPYHLDLIVEATK